jgi:hypothetical protein
MEGMLGEKMLRRRLVDPPHKAFTLTQRSRRDLSKLDSRAQAKDSAHTMSKSTKRPASSSLSSVSAEQLIRVRVKALEIPPIKDGIVIGRDAAIGGEAMVRTLRLMTNEKFERFTLSKDDIIQDVILRAAVVRKLGKDRVLKFVMERIKPVMTETELLMLDIDIELVIEDTV